MSLETQVKEAGKKYVAVRTIGDVLEKKPHDYQARIALGNLVHELEPAERADLAVGASNDVVDNYIGRYSERLENSLNDLIEGKLGRILSMIGKENLLRLIFAVKPYKTGNKEHDELADIHEKFMKLAGAAKQGNFAPYLALLSNEDAKQALAYRIKADPKRVLQNMAEYANELQGELIDKLEKKGEDYIRGYIARNYKKSDEDSRKALNIKAGALASDGKETVSHELMPQEYREAA